MGIQEHFHFYPLAFAFLWLIFICLLFGLIRSKKMQYPHYSYFLSAHFFKLGSAIVYSLVYILFYEGGDTTAYWDGAINLHNLLLDSPFHFLDEMLTPSGIQNMGANFNISTGYPPGWIYRETESFMVSKITVFLSIITFKSYFASTLIVASLMSLSSWYFFCTLRKLQLHNEKILAITILFTPTVLFWCTGISKDSYVLISLLMLLSILVRVFVLKQPLSKHWIFILIFTYLIFSMRAYVIIAIIPSLLLAYTVKLSKDNLENTFTRRVKKLAMYFISILFLIVYFQISTEGNGLEAIFNEILVIQQDFANNTTYGDKKYDLFLDDYTIPSLVKSIPNALLAAFYRPFIWEAGSPLLLFNGIENTILMLLTILFFRKNFKQKMAVISKEETLMFSLVFVFIMGFSIGFTSGLFGVLVRFKSIILPFMLLLLTIDLKNKGTALAKS